MGIFIEPRTVQHDPLPCNFLGAYLNGFVRSKAILVNYRKMLQFIFISYFAVIPVLSPSSFKDPF